MSLFPSIRRTLVSVVVTLVALAGVATAASAHDVLSSTPNPTVVLVHGAFADASGWNGVVERLQSEGYPVLAPSNPLRGLELDAAYIRSVVDSVDGPVVLVAHSYGGAVITNAATDAPNVRALVYVAAFAPDLDENLADLLAMNPGSHLSEEALIFRPHPTGVDGYVHPDAFHDVFAQDLSTEQAAVMAATQRPGDAATLSDHSATPAWRTIPSWYVVAASDHLIPPATQRFMAERAGSVTVEVPTSHVAMISDADAVTDVIIGAAMATG